MVQFDIVFHESIQMAEFFYDNDTIDGKPGRMMGLFPYRGSKSSSQKTSISFAAPISATELEATLDSWGIRRLDAGDFDYDGMLTVLDLDILLQDVRTESNDPRRDLNLDEFVNGDDRNVWVHDLVNTYFGDSNLDGEFDTKDLTEVFQAGQYEDAIELNSTWTTGDWNGDGDFTSRDLVFAFQDGGFEKGPRAAVHAVPEPSGVLLVVLAFLAFWRKCVTV